LLSNQKCFIPCAGSCAISESIRGKADQEARVYALQHRHAELLELNTQQADQVLNGQQPDAAQRARFVIACERVAASIRKVDFPYDALADEPTQAFLAPWFLTLSEAARPHLLKVSALFGGREVERGVITPWSPETNGYLACRWKHDVPNAARHGLTKK
jgi:hypothetical protein